MNDNSIDPRAFKPEQSVEVSVPTIVGRLALTGNGDVQLCVQWFGQSDNLESLAAEYGRVVTQAFNKAQFLFPILLKANNTIWMGHPERFEVISIGQIKDWPNQNVIPQLGDPEEWLLYISATHYKTAGSNGIEHPAFAIPLSVWIADGIYGVIKPQKYTAYEEATRTVTKIGCN